MATGMAIMGFGGGALIAAPLSVLLMKHFATATSNGRARNLRHHGRHLLHVHDDRRVPCGFPPPAGSRRVGCRRRIREPLVTRPMWRSPWRGARRNSGCCGRCSA